MISRRTLLAAAGFAAGAMPRTQAEPAPARQLRAGAVDGALGYDGTTPGPTLRVKRGEELRVMLRNDLTEQTSIHWHGLRVPNAMDGAWPLTQPPVAPGASFEYRFRPPDAGTFWYRARSASQIDRGLHGALIVEEEHPLDVDRDIVLVMGLRSAETGGPIHANGKLRPDIPVRSGERLRLRLVNATSNRGLALKLEAHDVRVMAIDGQPAEPFVARDSRVGIGPGGRLDLFVDLMREGGTTAALLAGPDLQPIARLVYETGPPARTMARREPAALPSNLLPERIDLKSAQRVELSITGPRPLDSGAPLFSVHRGRPVTLAIRNSSGGPQALHLHGHHFRLLDRLDDGWKPYWLDSLVVGEPIERIAFLADNPGKWLIESRMLERPGSEAAWWFTVT
ncbi:MAG: copper oxidase [Proteobacteria bacterium]|nr:MAG: copper oxidase [Pseudomonadota bacterium]